MDDNETITKAKQDRGATDKLKGHTKEVMGAVKEKVGSAVGDHELEAKGKMQHAEGRKDRLKGEVKESIANVEDDVREGIDKLKAGAKVVTEKVKEKLDH